MGTGHAHPAPQKGSCLGRLDARAKVLSVVPAIVFVNLLPFQAWLPTAGAGALFLVLIIACGKGRLTTLSRIFYFLPFVLFVVVTLPFSAPGEPVARLDVRLFELTATREGLERAAAVGSRALASILGVLFLSGTTEAADLFKALRSLGVPKAFVTILAMIYRYLFEIGDELARLRRAAAARCFEATNFRALGRMGQMGAALLARSAERSRRVHEAMLARGYDGELRTLHAGRFGASEAVFLAGFYVYFAALAAAYCYA